MNNFTIRERDQNAIEIFNFIISLFLELFPKEIKMGENCEIYNDIKSNAPMLVYTENPCLLRLCLKNGYIYWCQYIYQLSHELLHYVIRQTKPENQKFSMKSEWFEETLCEAFSIYALKWASINWNSCALSRYNVGYSLDIDNYIEEIINQFSKSSRPIIDNLECLLSLNKISQKEEGRKIRQQWVLEMYKTFCNSPKSLNILPNYHRYESEFFPVIDFQTWINESPQDILFITELSKIQPVFLNHNRLFIKFFNHIEPESLSKLYLYIQVLNSIHKDFLDFKNDPVDLIKDQTKISGATFIFQELLTKIYLILPVRVDIKGAHNRIHLYQTDNLFYKSIYADFWTDRLSKIVDDDNFSWFFCFNYFFRNASLHFKHLIDSPGQFGSRTGISCFDYRIEIDKESKSFTFFTTKMMTNNKIFIYNDKISITHNIESSTFYVEASIEVDFVHSLINSIKSSFVDGLKELIKTIELVNDEVLLSLCKIDKQRYMQVLGEWKESII